MDLQSLTIDQLKVMSWDTIYNLEDLQSKLQTINKEIHSRKIMEPETNPTDSTTEAVETPTEETTTETTEDVTV